MGWTPVDVEIVSLLFAALALATAGVCAVLLRSGYRTNEARRKRFATFRRAGHRAFARIYGPALGVAFAAAGIFVASGLPFSAGIAWGIGIGGVVTVAVAYVAFESEFLAVLRVVGDADLERAPRAGRAPPLAASVLAAGTVGIGLCAILGIYFASDGSVNDVLGLAIGIGLAALVTAALRWVDGRRRARTAPQPLDPLSGVGRGLTVRTVRSTDILASFVASVAAAMLIAYRDPLPLLLFPNALTYPAAVAGVGVLGTLGATAVLARRSPRSSSRSAVQTVMFLAVGMALVGQLVLVVFAMNGNLGLYLAGAVGTLVGAVSILIFLPRGARAGPDTSAPNSRWFALAPGIGMFAALVVMAVTAYLFASRMVVASGVAPIVDIGLYGVGLAAAGLASVLGPGLLVLSVPDIAETGLRTPTALGEASLPDDVADRLREETEAYPTATRAFGVSASAAAGFALLVADRVAVANVVGEAVAILPGGLQGVPWPTWVGLGLGAAAAILLGWFFVRWSSALPASPLVRGRLRHAGAAGVAFAALAPFLIASGGSVGLAWALGANAVLGFALGILVVGAAVGLVLCLPRSEVSSPSGTGRPAVRRQSPEEDTALLLSGAVRTSLVLAVGVLLPFAAVITSCYLGCY